MATYTTRLNATKAASSENVDVTTHLNNNFDLFDAAVGSSVGTSAARPASAFSGRLWYSTDVAKLYVNSSATSGTASWQDAVANALTGAVTIGGVLTMSAGEVAVTRSASSSNALTAKVSGDTQQRLAVSADGKHNWSNGASAADTNLYRSTADTLRTDDSLIVGGTTTSVGAVTASTNLTVGGDTTVTGGLTVTGKGQKRYVRKTLSTGRVSTTTLADDPHITFSLAASAVYMLSAYLAVSGPAAGDFKTAWSVTGAASGGSHARAAHGPATTITAANAAEDMRFSRPTLTGNGTYGLDGTLVTSVVENLLLDTAPGSGTITLQWAQNTSNATSTVVSSDSWAIIERLA